MDEENDRKKSPEDLEEPPEVKAFFELLGKAADVVEKRNAAIRQEALENIPKFRKATKEYLTALENMKLPECYVKTLSAYIGALQMYNRERLVGLCGPCNFNIGVVMPIFKMPPEPADPDSREALEQEAGTEEKDEIPPSQRPGPAVTEPPNTKVHDQKWPAAAEE
jgi:hypothetical protein